MVEYVLYIIRVHSVFSNKSEALPSVLSDVTCDQNFCMLGRRQIVNTHGWSIIIANHQYSIIHSFHDGDYVPSMSTLSSFSSSPLPAM